jgi:hypothetical protein
MNRISLLLVWIFAVAAFATDNPQLVPGEQPGTFVDQNSVTSALILQPDGSEPAVKVKDPNHRYVRRDPQNVTCLKMRSYLMAREGSDSDETTLVGYTTCTPTSSFDVKRTIDPRPVSKP